MKYAINVKAIHAGEFNLEDANFEVSWETAEIKDVLTHLLPFVKNMAEMVTEKVVPLVQELKKADREYCDGQEDKRNKIEAAEKALQREHELSRDTERRAHEVAMNKASQEHEMLMQRIRLGKTE